MLCRLTLVCLGLALLGSPALARGPRYYFEVQSVQVPVGAAPTLKEKARGLLLAELKKQPQVILELGASGPELEKALKARKLDGYRLVLRVVKSSHSLSPPPAGKVYKVLMVETEVAIDAEKIPSGQMALAGQGTASVGTEVKAVKEQEKQQLLLEALTEAIKQAVEKSISKLGGAKASKPPRRKKR